MERGAWYDAEYGYSGDAAGDSPEQAGYGERIDQMHFN